MMIKQALPVIVGLVVVASVVELLFNIDTMPVQMMAWGIFCYAAYRDIFYRGQA